MERRLAITYLVSATATFGIGCVAIAAAGGSLFASAAQKPAGGKQIEVIDDYVVIHSSTTVAPGDGVVALVDPTGASADSLRAALARPQAAAGAAAPDATASAAPVPTLAPLSAAPTDAPTPAPAAVAAPIAEVPDPTDPPEASEVPATNPPAPQSPAPISTAPAARPPIPDGCADPRFANGHWTCDDD